MIDVFLPERVATIVREAELVEETALDREAIYDHENSPTLRRRLAAAGRRRVEALFGADLMVGRVEALYENLVRETVPLAGRTSVG